MATKLFSELGISSEVLKAIDQLGFEQASPIQAEAIPVLLSGADVVGQSQTGSGKTAAFAVPAIEKVDLARRDVQVLILCPTRELAVQVSEEVHKLALFKQNFHALPVYGGQSYERQFYGLKQGAQIVIGTPGRVMDHMRRGTLRLETVGMVVLDEADVMLDMGFREDIEFILQAIPSERQTVFFSATMPRAIQELIKKYAREPRDVRIEQKTVTVPTVEQCYYEVDRRRKLELLTRLIDLHDLKLGIVFCNTKRMVDELVDHLNAQGYSADRLHGDMSQGMRDRVMNKFRRSGLEFLVATDVAARGIDVDDVQVVFNYDLPYDAEDYVHRIGRTGRVGRSGRAISFLAGRELFQIQHIERYTRVKIQRGKPPTIVEVEEARAGQALEKLRATLQEGKFKRQDHLVECLLEEGFSSTDIASALLHQMQAGESNPRSRGPRQVESGEPESSRLPAPPPQTDPRRTQDPVRQRRNPRSEPGGSGFSRPFAGKDRFVRGRSEGDRREQGGPNRSAHRTGEGFPRQEPWTGRRPGFSRAPGAPGVGGKPFPDRGRDRARQAPDQGKPVAERPRSYERRPHPRPQPKSVSPVKPSRRTPEEQTRLHVNIGSEMGVQANDVVGAIMGETGLAAKVVGKVDIRDRHLFVDVDSTHSRGIMAKLNRAQFKNHRLKAKLATVNRGEGDEAMGGGRRA